MKLDIPWIASALALALMLIGWTEAAAAQRGGWQDDFPISKCNLLSTGRNAHFVLEPGYQLVLEGGGTRLVITVLDRTRTVDNVTTRVVEEREWKNGKLHEVAMNYFALCAGSNDLYYFGEDVDLYGSDGKITHDGSWLAGIAGNRAGLMMPGTPKVGMKYYQELASGVAMDRAEIVSVSEQCKTPAGTFSNCLKVRESSALEPGVKEVKYYAPGVGLVGDGTVKLVRHGFVR